MKNLHKHNIFCTLGLGMLLLSLSSCDDFLNNEPMDFADETAYFRTPDDLKLSVNAFYEALPKMKTNYEGIHSEDNTSDNQCGTRPAALFYQGEKRTPLQTESDWKFSNLRGINYFINTAEEKLSKGEISGSQELIDNYLGEGYFFRAYDYFRLLRQYGDLPILTEMLPDDLHKLASYAVRQPRTKVVRFMLTDLDRAISLLPEKALESGRVSRDAALLLKARVALYEATWERYHAGTVFVPGNEKWAAVSGNHSFQWPAGSADNEVNWLLDQACAAAGQVADHRSLESDYQSMFCSTQAFPADHEVILARYYMPNVLTHSASNYLGRTGAGTGLTRSLVSSFLTTNGLPIYAANNSLYKGDNSVWSEMENRDMRFTTSCKGGGLVTTAEGDTVHYFRPHITESGNQGCTTGYEICKWVSSEPGQDEYTQGTTATPLMRAAEAYLIYLEAYYERHHALDSRCDTYWRALRTRAGVDPNYEATIAATELDRENDLAVYSRGTAVDATLYNIRRERRCEFVAEGMRLDDLKRWRALDKMQSYQPEGVNFWTELHLLYKPSDLQGNVVSQQGLSPYLRPLQKETTGVCYSSGYCFPLQHYLEPIPVSEFALCRDESGRTTLYQNPGWPTIDGTADYTFDCQ